MLWLDPHTRTRRKLSPYIDGQLSARERTSVEAHLDTCDACRRELEELRATISAVGGLGEVEPPRSFALTPRMLEERRTAPPAGVPPLAVGMRLAGAGVALVLALVVVGDLGGIGGGMNNGGDESGGAVESGDIRTTMSERDTAAEAPGPGATGAAEEYAADAADRASPDDSAVTSEDPEACPPAAGLSNESPGVDTDALAAATTTPEPAPNAAGAAGGPAACAPAAAADGATGTEEPVAGAIEPQDEGSAAPVEAASEDDGGVSTLTLIEIVLGGALVALLGGVAIEYMLRRRAA